MVAAATPGQLTCLVITVQEVQLLLLRHACSGLHSMTIKPNIDDS